VTPSHVSPRRISRPRVSAVWIAAAVLLFVPGLWTSRLPLFTTTFRIPKTPVDLTWDRYARFWSFLKEARHHVPEGRSYTVIASDRDEEMYLYMFSLGIFERHVALPSSYFGHPTGDGDRARYVLAYHRVLKTVDLRLVASLEEGAVYERTHPDQ
jgi:hypothetical protein